MLVEKIFLVLKRFFGIPSFFNSTIVDEVNNLLYPDKMGLHGIKQNSIDDFQICFELQSTQY